jgi:hypothetical protein
MSISYFDQLPHELLDKIFIYLAPEEILRLSSIADITRRRYYEDYNNRFWNQMMVSKYGGKAMCIRDQALEQSEKDTRYMEEYQRFHRRCRVSNIIHYQLADDSVASDIFITSGFLNRYPWLADDLFMCIFNNLRYEFREHEQYGVILNLDKIYRPDEGTRISTIILAIMFRRTDILKYLLEKATQLNLFEDISYTCGYIYNYIYQLMKYHHFDLLPMFYPYMDRLLNEIPVYRKNSPTCFNRPLTTDDVNSIIQFLTMHIQFIESNPVKISVPGFIMFFLGDFCYPNYVELKYQLDTSYEPIIVFCCEQLYQRKNDNDHDLALSFLSHYNLLYYDNLVRLFLAKTNILNKLNILIFNSKCYPEHQNMQRIKFCLENGNYDRPTYQNNIDILFTSSIIHNTPSITELFCNHWSIKNTMYNIPDLTYLTAEMLQVLTKYRIVLVTNGTIKYDLESVEQIEQYYQQFHIITTELSELAPSLLTKNTIIDLLHRAICCFPNNADYHINRFKRLFPHLVKDIDDDIDECISRILY